MYLKSITLYGFKSFGQDTRIVLEPGISVIVGPNGGGKSNVIDAIRWALGEQRVKDLRAERWEDLLHVGGKNQRAKMAEVSLLFDNHDAEMTNWPDSLQVTRRYYASGDSEYLLNGRDVRLKDVVDLFLDSGIGRFNYAIVGQGRVEQALLMKPKERLEQLEEAAGVSRYKVKRRETLQHLTDVVRNLERLGDLMADVRQQKDQIADEARGEREYLELQRQYTELQTRYQLTQYLQALKERHEYQNTLQMLKRERADLQQELQVWQSDADRSSALHRQTIQQLEQAQGSLENLKYTLSNVGTHIARLEAELEGLERETKRVREQTTRTANQLDDMDENQPQITDDDAADDNIMVGADLKGLEDKIRALQQQFNEKAREKLNTEANLREIEEQQQQHEKRLARLEGVLHVKEDDDLLSQIATLEDEQRQLHKACEDAQKQRRFLEHRCLSGQQELVRVKADVQKSQKMLWELQAQVKALEAVGQNPESTPTGVRAVLEAQKLRSLEGVLGTVGSLITVPAAYAQAIDMALGNQRHDLITDTERNARQVIEWIKRKRAGWVTILPLDQIRPFVVPLRDQGLNNQPGVVGWAIDQLEFGERLFPAISYVLGRVLLIESLDVGNTIGRLHQFRYKMVSLDGQVILAGGAISGGSARNWQSGLRQKTFPLLERINHLNDALKDKQQRHDELDRELSQCRRQLEEAQQRVIRHTERLDQLRGLQTADNLNQQSVRDMLVAVQELQGHGVSEKQNLTQQNREIEKIEKDLAHLKEVYISRQQASMNARQIRSHRLALLARYEEEKQRLNAQFQEHEQHLQQLLQTSNEVRKQLQLRHDEYGQNLRSIDQESRRAETIQKSLLDIEEHLKEQGNRIRSIDSEDRKIAGRITHLEQQVLKIDTRWDGYQPPKEEPLEEREMSRAQKLLDEWRKALDRLRPFRPGVYALYTQLEDRLSFLEVERHDVELAMRELRESLRQIDQEVDARLSETATQVERAFYRACSALFGGEGGFRWIQGEERGVELWIRPPGKKPSTITLLSGGEKALGGISWLFALLSVRPSPFVVLDEVEAALDETNAQRVAQYIRAHHGRTQYVIVTHHKSTMTIADALWGVAGDGHGRSRLVSVRIEQNLNAYSPIDVSPGGS